MRRLKLLLAMSIAGVIAVGNAFAQSTLENPFRPQTDDVVINDESRAQTDDELFFASKRKTWVEVWGFHNDHGNDSATNNIQPRLYHSFPLGRSGRRR